MCSLLTLFRTLVPEVPQYAHANIFFHQYCCFPFYSFHKQKKYFLIGTPDLSCFLIVFCFSNFKHHVFFMLLYNIPILQAYVSDLHDKMVGISLFGTVTSVCKVSTSGTTFYLELEDTTGVVLMKLIFVGPWYFCT